MFVSTKYLSLMEFVPGSRRRPAEIEPLAEPCQRTTPCLLERFAFAHDCLEPLRQQRADRPALLCGQDTRLAEEVDVQFERHVRFHPETSHVIIVLHDLTCYREGRSTSAL